MKPSLEQAEAIVRLQALPEWAVFMGLIGGQAEKMNRHLIMKDDIDIDMLRGELRSLVKLTMAIDNAPATIEAYRQPKT